MGLYAGVYSIELDKKEMIVMDYKQVGKRMRKERLRLDLTQAQVAEAAGISTKYYANVERGENQARLAIYYNVARALGVTLDTLVQDSDDPVGASYTNYILSGINHFSKEQKAMLHDCIKMIEKYQIEEKE